MHSSGTVVATSSGQRSLPGVDDSDDSTEDGERNENEIDEEGGDDENISEESDSGVSSPHSVKPSWQTQDNSIKVWSL